MMIEPSSSPVPVPRRCLARPRRGIRSFTLIEMLVSIAIFSIISVLLITLLNQVAASWNQIEAQVDTRQNGRAILTMMASDLRGAALPADRQDTNSLQFLIDPTNFIGASPNLLNPHAFFWQAPIATSTTYGNMAEVGYYVQWDTNNAANPRPILCRFFANPTSRFTGASTNSYLIYTSPSAWISPSIATSNAPGTFSTSNVPSSYSGWVADNVLGLWVRALDSGGYPITNTALVTNTVSSTDLYAYDSRQGYTTTYQSSGGATLQKTYYVDPGVTISGGYGKYPLQLCNLPAYVDIAVMVIDSRTALRLTQVVGNTSASVSSTNYSSGTISTNSPTKFWEEINAFYAKQPTYIQSGARIYSTRVQLNNAY